MVKCDVHRKQGKSSKESIFCVLEAFALFVLMVIHYLLFVIEICSGY